MADHLRPMEELLQIPIVGIEDAIVVPAVLVNEFELKPELLDFVSNNPFFGLENDDPHSHISRFYQITRTLRLNQVPDDVVKLILFPFYLKGAAETWLENKPPNSITPWDDLDQAPETITEVVEIASSKSTPLVPPPKTPPLSVPKLKEDPKLNPYQLLIPYPCRLQEEKFQALENPKGRADYFVYRIDIVDSLYVELPIGNNSLSGSPTLSLDPVVESLPPSLIPSREIDLLLDETDAFLSLDDSIPLDIDNGIYDSEGDILFLKELLNDEIPSDLPPKELKDDELNTTKSLIKKPLKIDNGIYDSERDILFLENLLKDGPLEADKSEIYTLIREPPDTFLMEDEEIKLNPLKDSDDFVPIPRNEHSDEPETETMMDAVHSTVQIPPLFEELTSDKSMQNVILHRICHGMVNSYHLSVYLDFFSPEDNFESLSSDSFELGDQNVVFDPGIFFINGVFSLENLHIY
ncbi:hypothetical protein Tco_0434457 [Tanacetum coccineum]